MKALGLVLTIALLLAITSCTTTGPNGNASPSPTASTSTPTPVSPSPVVSPSAPASPGPSAPATAGVKGSNFKWTDDVSGTPVTTIKVGGSITWTITDGKHKLERVAGNATNGCGQLPASFDSGDLTSGQTVTRTFTQAGTFGYHCGIHLGDPNCKTPPGSGPMPGVIKVVP